MNPITRLTRNRTGPASRRQLAALAAGVATVTALALALPAATASAAPAALPSNCTQSGPTVTCTYGYTGGEQTFTVPAGVTAVQVTAVGAAGAASFGHPAPPGGRGAEVAGALTGLTTGATLYVEVGGTPTTSTTECREGVACVGGFNGGGSSIFGGGGGGASDVRTRPSAQSGSLGSRLIVAAGGGGGGEPGLKCDDPGTAGGDAGAAGATSSCAGVGTSTGGGPGTQTAGGTAGTPDGNPGALGVGGGGGEGGAGGAGGLYGGGGGGRIVFSPNPGFNTAGGGGGGGSSLVPAGGSESLTSSPTSVTISYTAPVTDHDLGITVPGNTTTDATGPSGAAVSFAVTVTDPDDATAPAVTCTIPGGASVASGSVFPIGTTTVTCAAADSDDANSPVSASFTITVLGAAAQLASLGQAVQGVGPGTSLEGKITAAQSYLASGDVADACGTLTGFVNEVQAQSGKSIPAGQAAQLIADAQRIQAVLAC